MRMNSVVASNVLVSVPAPIRDPASGAAASVRLMFPAPGDAAVASAAATVECRYMLQLQLLPLLLLSRSAVMVSIIN